jgi:hypothetical protein
MRYSRIVCGLVGLCLFVVAGAAPGAGDTPQAQTAPRYTGSQFARHITGMDAPRREEAILAAILSGNLPAFLRTLVPIALDYHAPSGKTLSVTLFVMPDYLAIGSDQDFLRMPMNLHTAFAVASRMGFVLPTRKIVDAIYRQSAFHFSPEPMTPGPQMGSTEYYRVHNEKIDAQSPALGGTPGILVSGHKKDVVISPRLTANPERLAIYGWHQRNGAPIQPLSTVHGACYADYSHGIRMVSETAVVDGERRSIYDLLDDPDLAGIVSDEGPIRNLRTFVTRQAEARACGQPTPASPPAFLTGAHEMSLTQRNPR